MHYLVCPKGVNKIDYDDWINLPSQKIIELLASALEWTLEQLPCPPEEKDHERVAYEGAQNLVKLSKEDRKWLIACLAQGERIEI